MMTYAWMAKVDQAIDGIFGLLTQVADELEGIRGRLDALEAGPGEAVWRPVTGADGEFDEWLAIEVRSVEVWERLVDEGADAWEIYPAGEEWRPRQAFTVAPLPPPVVCQKCGRPAQVEYTGEGHARVFCRECLGSWWLPDVYPCCVCGEKAVVEVTGPDGITRPMCAGCAGLRAQG